MIMFSGSGGGGGGGGGGMGGMGDISQGLTQMFGGIFGHSDKPYREAKKILEDYLGRARDTQNPFLDMGKSAIPKYQEWLNGMKDPSGFINGLMNNYGESPWAKFQQEQALRASGNAGSAAGLGGSTPMSQFNQQNARDISSQDMDKWLQNVLGINKEYGTGLGNEINSGQHAADSLTNLYSDMGSSIAGAKYGQQAAKNKDRNDIWGGAFKTGEGIAKAYFGGGMM